MQTLDGKIIYPCVVCGRLLFLEEGKICSICRSEQARATDAFEVEVAMEILAAGSLTDSEGREVPTTLVERARNVIDALAAETDARRDLEEENARLRAELLAHRITRETIEAWQETLTDRLADEAARRTAEHTQRRELMPPLFIGWIDRSAEE